ALDYGKPGFDRRALQIICTPLLNGVSYGIRAGAALEEAERARGQFGVDIYGHDVPPVARLVKQVRGDERVQGVLKGRRGTSIDGLPFAFEETAEAPQRLANINVNVLSLAGAVSPQCRDRNGLGGGTNRGHRAKPMGAGNDRIGAVEGELAAAVRARHSDVFEHRIDAAVQVEIRAALRIRELRLKRLGEQIRLGLFAHKRGCIIHLPTPSRAEALSSSLPFLACGGGKGTGGAAAALRRGDGVRGGRLALLPQFDKHEQYVVPLLFQVRDGARSDLGMDAVNELLLQLRSEHRRAEGLPPSRHRGGELLEEVLDAARTAAEVIEHHIAHDTP